MRHTNRTLVVEGGDHYKILEQIFHILEPHCDLTFLFTRPLRYDFESLFPSAKRTRVLAWRDRGLLTFMRVLFVGWRYQHIYISTGPDGEHYTDIVNVLFFFLCCLFYGHKITMTLRNTKPYLESDPGIYSFIRSRAIRHVRRFTFETATMRDIFIALTERRNVLSGVSYDKYPDVPIDGVEVAPQPDVSGKTRIGLLGSVNAERRDYEFVASALERLTDDEQKSICLATIGQCDGGAQHPEMLKISRFAEVDCKDGLLSEIELIERGSACSVLLAPFRFDRPVGTFHGSGSFGDAIFLRRTLIMPRFADADEEFSDICHYYDDVDGLAAILRSVVSTPRVALSDSHIEPYRTDMVFAKLCDDLKLCG